MSKSTVQIFAVRKSLRMSQLDLGRLLNVHHMTVSKWERGVLSPKPWHLALLKSFSQAVTDHPNEASRASVVLLDKGVSAALCFLLRLSSAAGDSDNPSEST